MPRPTIEYGNALAADNIDIRCDTAYDTRMPESQIVVDTSVLIAALYSQLGTAYRLLSLVGTGKFEINISVPLALEYEDVAKRMAEEFGLTLSAIDDIIDYLCSVAVRHQIHYLWRPVLPDPKDDLVLEVAVAGECDAIITYNRKDFRGAEQFGIKILTPSEFLVQIGALS